MNYTPSPPPPAQIITANYGTWDSPFTAKIVAEGAVSILNMYVDDTVTYWCEMRPTNKGRYTIVSCDENGNTQDITPPDFNVRTFVHEYGGGAFTVDKNVVYASNAADHAVYSIRPGTPPKKITEGQKQIEVDGKPISVGTRFADMHVSPLGLIAVGEEHTSDHQVNNFIALINTETGQYKKLASGYDFYICPAISPDAKKIAWVCWNHPNMPWTESELWIGNLEASGTVTNPQRIAGDIPESIIQPQWDKNGVLYFVSDRDKGWWNIHRYFNGKIENICPVEAEIGEPHWIFGRSSYAILDDKIFFSCNKNAQWQLGVLNTKTSEWEFIPREAIAINHLRAAKDSIRFTEGYADRGPAVIKMNNTPGYPSTVILAEKMTIDPGYISSAQHISYPSNERIAYGLYYAPKNKDFKAPADELPPLIVIIHGGPTSQAIGLYSQKLQYWTSRGFAVLDVNHGGSTGYGREFRSLLDDSWGIVDVEDCENGAIYLANQYLVDPNKFVIRGGSAGGYTTLAALAFKTCFKAGANYFGVADITALAADTHKFEKHYMDSLVGKYPEKKAVWDERSPINSIDKINVPLIIFQGEEDPIVPPNQSIMIYEGLKKRGIPTILHLYPGEQHGFRQSQNIIHSLEEELAFYLNVFNLNKTKN